MRALSLLLLVAACGPRTRGVAAPRFAARRAEAPACATGLRLDYRVEGPAGPWRWEVLRRGARYVERRTPLVQGRSQDARALVLGRTEEGAAFVRVGAGPARPAGDLLRAQIATRASLFGGALACDAGAGWRRRGAEYFYRPPEGQTLAFLLAHPGALPEAWDHTDLAGRLQVCESLEWRGPVPAGGTCRSTHSFDRRVRPRALETRFALEVVQRTRQDPPWAQRGPVAEPLEGTHAVPLPDPLRPSVRVAFGDGPPLELLVDTGAPFTVLDARAARRAGVARYGDVPLYADPPWLPAGEREVAVADRVALGALTLPAMALWVQDGLGAALGEADGLLGLDVLRHLLLDVDAPAGELRFHAPDAFEPRGARPDATLRDFGGRHRVRVPGAVAGVGEGSFIVDTGATLAAAVDAPGMRTAYPRRDATPVPRAFSERPGAVDHAVRLRGLRLGPYPFPATEAWARYEVRDRFDGRGLGLVGMGTLRFFRVVVDARAGEVHLWESDAYRVLRRYGVEIGEEEGRVVLRRVERGPLSAARLRGGEVLRAIEGLPVRDAAQARRLLLGVRGGRVHLRVGLPWGEAEVVAASR